MHSTDKRTNVLPELRRASEATKLGGNEIDKWLVEVANELCTYVSC